MDNRLERLASWKQQAYDFTRALRTGDDPFMIRVREIAAERGLEPQKMACVSAFDDMLDNYCGLLILEDGSAVEFELDFHEIQLDAPASPIGRLRGRARRILSPGCSPQGANYWNKNAWRGRATRALPQETRDSRPWLGGGQRSHFVGPVGGFYSLRAGAAPGCR